MRDAYTQDDPWLQAWVSGDREEFERRLTRPWLDLIREATGRRIRVHRARVVSEPVTDYIRFEHATTGSNLVVGEDVRSLPRHLATGLLLPANDYRVFDRQRAHAGFRGCRRNRACSLARSLRLYPAMPDGTHI
jgi:hypothetical protein